jgi:hypothetical protein
MSKRIGTALILIEDKEVALVISSHRTFAHSLIQHFGCQLNLLPDFLINASTGVETCRLI